MPNSGGRTDSTREAFDWWGTLQVPVRLNLANRYRVLRHQYDEVADISCVLARGGLCNTLARYAENIVKKPIEWWIEKLCKHSTVFLHTGSATCWRKLPWDIRDGGRLETAKRRLWLIFGRRVARIVARRKRQILCILKIEKFRFVDSLCDWLF